MSVEGKQVHDLSIARSISISPAWISVIFSLLLAVGQYGYYERQLGVLEESVISDHEWIRDFIAADVRSRLSTVEARQAVVLETLAKISEHLEKISDQLQAHMRGESAMKSHP